jgi:site-specific DNA-methyltransferase (adenine-specific)
MSKNVKNQEGFNHPKFFFGNIELYNGNNTDILKNINLDLSKCIFVSDPPFNIGYHYNQYKDKMKEDDYYNWLFEIFGTNKQVIIHYPEYLYKYSFKIGLTPEKVVSWVYNSNTGKQHRDIAFFGVKPDFRKVGQDYKNPKDKRIAKRILEGKKAKLYDWWEINQVKNVSLEKTEHPCQMPLKVMENIIGILPDEYTIIDPFLGSGTTALACQKYGRKFIGIELDFKYFEISKQRILDVYKK